MGKTLKVKNDEHSLGVTCLRGKRKRSRRGRWGCGLWGLHGLELGPSAGQVLRVLNNRAFAPHSTYRKTNKQDLTAER